MNVRRVIPKDAIPSVDDPTFGTSYDGAPDELVIVVDSADSARAYPVRYLRYHEIVNDVLGGNSPEPAGDPIAVTWCPLCASGVVYDRRHNGQTLEFGVSGKLADDDLVMYDRETESEWKQSSGECLTGSFVGESLTVRPAAVLTWGAFRDSYPDGVVLQPPGGTSEAASDTDEPAPIAYDDAPYEAYRSGSGFGLAAHRGTGDEREWSRDDDIRPKTVVLGVETETAALGFPLPRVREAGGIVQTTVGDRDVVVIATDEAGLHGFADPGIDFELVDRGRTDDRTVTGDGTTWNPATGEAADGRRLDRLATRRLFAFTWQDDHGTDAFYRASGE